MIRICVDENFNNKIVRGLLRRNPKLDVVRIQDIAGLSGADDPTVLDWAAKESRVLLTHDVNTLAHFAFERVDSGRPMPGVFEVSRSLAIGQAIEEILLLAECSYEGEWQGQVIYLPLRVRIRGELINSGSSIVIPQTVECNVLRSSLQKPPTAGQQSGGRGRRGWSGS